MPAYETDREQIELVKKWWNDFGKWIIIAVVIGLGLGLGWRYWQQQQQNHHQQASLLYQQLLVADKENKSETVLQMSDEITRRYSNMGYAALANLLAVKSAVNLHKNDLGLQKLQWVIDHTHHQSIKQIARLRAARLLLSLNKATEAQKTIKIIDDKTFQPVIDEIQGDIYAALGDSVKAHQAYQQAQIGFSAIFGEDMLLSIKLSQL